ncbi:MAG: transketolase, partial [Bacilli bacterium]|nr:transketolase [Bacilli bacterium]
MKQPVVYVFTHDTLSVGEDGPTHEPVEQLPSLRALPGITVIRPADANETAQAWKYAIENKHGPTALILTRQNLPILQETAHLAPDYLKRGAYVVSDAQNAQAILLASGSEVSLAVNAQRELYEEGIAVRVVSMPSWELFEKQTQDYKESVLPAHLTARVGIEMAVPFGWDRYVGSGGRMIAMHGFGASGKAEDILPYFGFTVPNVAATVKELLGIK